MATPSSSTTTPSPRPVYLQAAVVVPPTATSSKDDSANEQEERQRVIQKFLASAEVSQLARGLRTRLAYASFKATHDLTHNTLPDLEAQVQSHATSAKMSGVKLPSNHYNNPATQGNSAMAGASSSKAISRKGTMPPPTITASATQSLYASLLQPPPSKRARTIHNPQDPPLAPSTKPKHATPPRKSTKAARNAHSTQSKTKIRKEEKGKRKETARGTGSSRNRITPQSTLGSDGFVNEDVDMKAAATLTSLLHSRPSKSVTASSPRSSMSAGSDAGSTHSYSQYAQSSTRSTAPTSLVASQEQSFGGFPRASTPPRHGHVRTQSLPHLRANGTTTPKSQAKPSGSRLAGSTTPVPPSDSEAADLMLFLATSPSPVRPSSKEKDPSLLRSLSGNSALRGRVLFGQGSEERAPSSPRPLQREATGSFNSVATELTSETIASGSGSGSQERGAGVPATSSLLNPNHNRASTAGSSSSLKDAALAPAPNATPTAAPLERSPTQLLPAPSSPTRPRSVPVPGEAKPGGSAFNISEYINVSPAGPAKPANLRADVGRRLFEEHHAATAGTAGGGGGGGGVEGQNQSQSQSQGEPVLGAGIDLVKSPA